MTRNRRKELIQESQHVCKLGGLNSQHLSEEQSLTQVPDLMMNSEDAVLPPSLKGASVAPCHEPKCISQLEIKLSIDDSGLGIVRKSTDGVPRMQKYFILISSSYQFARKLGLAA